jgi:hypothetical protein
LEIKILLRSLRRNSKGSVRISNHKLLVKLRFFQTTSASSRPHNKKPLTVLSPIISRNGNKSLHGMHPHKNDGRYKHLDAHSKRT